MKAHADINISKATSDDVGRLAHTMRTNNPNAAAEGRSNVFRWFGSRQQRGDYEMGENAPPSAISQTETVGVTQSRADPPPTRQGSRPNFVPIRKIECISNRKAATSNKWRSPTKKLEPCYSDTREQALVTKRRWGEEIRGAGDPYRITNQTALRCRLIFQFVWVSGGSEGKQNRTKD